ncbi:MAG: hypothetical protein IKK93_00450 [Campylobacter sp.]|nr:hypothetical protein [Campylobacter sp.]
MICPNGTLSLKQLYDMVYSKDYVVWYEPNDEPSDWDWKTKGFYRSPNKIKITTQAALLDAFRKEYDKEGRIVYDLTDTYFSNHPYEGEEVKHVKETFDWQYASPFGNKYCYKICSCSYLGEPPKFIPLEIVCYENGFNDSCFTIGHWDRDDEGYEFHSVGSRLFKYVHEKDVELIWKIIKEADDFLAKRYKEENEQ